MDKMRVSLIYLASYLLAIGFGLLLAPQWTLSILQAKGEYGDVFVQIAGMLMSGLGFAVAGMIINDTAVLYPATLFIRAYFLTTLGVFYVLTQDPLFIVLLVIVGLGFVLTFAAFLSKRN